MERVLADMQPSGILFRPFDRTVVQAQSLWSLLTRERLVMLLLEDRSKIHDRPGWIHCRLLGGERAMTQMSL